MSPKTKTRIEITVFLAFTAAFSAVAYIPIIRGGSISGPQAKFAGLLMLAPGLAGAISCLIFEHSLQSIGWRPGKPRYLLLALFIPLGYCLVEYGICWLAGAGQYNGRFPPDFPVYLLVLLFSGMMSGLLEEAGWRGFLVPKMSELTGFTGMSFITGLIWAGWHYPLIIFTDVRAGAPLPLSMICFTIFTVGLGFALNWLRLKSGSVWVAALIHGSHNAFMLHVFNILTTDTGRAWHLLGEYGIATAAVGLVMAAVFWSLRKRLPEKNSFVAKSG